MQIVSMMETDQDKAAQSNFVSFLNVLSSLSISQGFTSWNATAPWS